MQFCLDNNVGITSMPVVGAEYIVSDAALALGDSGMVLQIQQGGIIISTRAQQYILPEGLLDTDETPLTDADGTPLTD